MLSHFLRAASGGSAQFVSVSSNTGTTTVVINKPSGTQESNFLLAVMTTENNGTTWTGDTGWTEILDNGSTRIAYKVATSSEPSTYTFTSSSSGTVTRGCILCYRNAAYDTIGTADTTSPFTPAGITMSKAGLLIGVITRAGGSSQTLTLPASMTSRFNSSASSATIAVGDEAVLAGPTGSTRTFTSTSGTATSAVLLGIKNN